MKLKEILKNYCVLLITILAMLFWIGFFASENIYNQNNTYYSFNIKSEVIESAFINADFFLDALKKVDDEGNVSYSYATVNPNEFFSNGDIKIIGEKGFIKLSIKAKYFIGSDEMNISDKSLERFMKVIKKVVGFYDKDAIINGINVEDFTDIKNIEVTNYINPYYTSIFSLAGGFLIFCIVMFLLRNKLKFSNQNIYENENIFKTPFSKKYWKKAIDSLRKMKIFDMCLISILFALQMITKFITIPSGFPNLELNITYLIFAYICLIYGPIWGLIIGFSSDIFGFMMNPTIFHPGYTLQAMLTGFVYGLFFYKTDLKFSKVLLCRIVVNIFLNGIYGSFLWGSYAGLSFDATITYMTIISLPKNIIYLIPQSILLYFFLRLAVPLLVKKNIVPVETIYLK